MRRGRPNPKFPVQVMVSGLCPKAGSGLLRLKWQTKPNFIVEREWVVQRGLPGEIVEMNFGVVKEKRYPHGDLDVYPDFDVKKVTSSPFEVRPACPHYDYCGGCDFLHLKYGRQLIEKQRWVEQATLGAKAPLKVLSRIRPSEPQVRYANRIEWFFSEEEGEPRFGPKGTSGPTAAEDPLRGCVLPPRAAAQALGVLCEVFRDLRQSSVSTYSIYEELRGFGTFRSGVAIGTRAPPGLAPGLGGRRTEVLLNIVIAQPVEDVEGVLAPLAQAIVAAAPRCLVGIVVNVARSKKDLMGGRREILLHGRRFARQELLVPVAGGKPRSFVLEVGAGSRLLAPAGALGQVARCVVEFAGIRETDVVWHCFCGGGELSLALGASCEHVVAIGTSAAEVSELKRNLAANDVANTTSVLCNLRSPWTLKHLSYHISQSQQRRLLLGTGEEQEKARDFAIACFVPGEGRRRQMQRLCASPFTGHLLRQDALAYLELQTLLPAFVRDFRPNRSTTLPVPVKGPTGEEVRQREVPPEMETRLKRLYRRLALKYHPDKNPNDPEASERFQALTRAYRALVGDTAGPEEEDEKVEDPFVKAMHSSYRPKFKHRWMREEPAKVEEPAPTPSAPQEVMGLLDEGDREPGLFDNVDDTDEEAKDEEAVAEDEDEELSDSDFAVKMEIDEAWATPAQPWWRQGASEYGREVSSEPEVVVREDRTEITASGQAALVKTLPPPDVLVVSQPRNRKPGRGTPRYFHSWLRSTAARAIVYVSHDPEAFRNDLKALMNLGYRLERLQPFDPEPHRRGVLLVARLELVRPLEGSADYAEDADRLLAGGHGLLPGGPQELPLLGAGGYAGALALPGPPT